MRWFVAGAAGIALLWVAYLGSPYLALGGLARSVAAGDAAAVASRINLHALRLSIARQLVAEGFGGPEAGHAANPSERQLTAATIAAAADPLLEPLLTVEGVSKLLGGVSAAREGEAAVSPVSAAGLSRLAAIVGASRWRGFRNVYFSLPLGQSGPRRYRLQFRLTRLSWRLVGLDLPAELGRQLADEVAATHRRDAMP